MKTNVKALSLILIGILCGCQKQNEVTQDVEIVPSGKESNTTKVAGAGPDFIIAIIPDTQYYTWSTPADPSGSGGGTLPMFASQINWIRNNRIDSNIVYVTSLGDIVDNGASETQWIRAKDLWYKLDTPMVGQTAIPYGLAVGNHDQTPNGYAIQDGDYTKNTLLFNKYFGIAHFSKDINGNPRTYYHSKVEYGNDSHYDLISASGMDLVIIYLEYNGDSAHELPGLNNWCDDILAQYPDRKAIIVSHSIVAQATNDEGSAGFSGDGGQALYDRIKGRKNVILMLGGHICSANSTSPGYKGEGYNHSTYDGHSIRSMLSDYQHREWGGNGKMRLLKISPANDRFTVMTYSPFTNTYEIDATSRFTKPLLFDERTSRTCDFNNNGISEWAFFKSGIWKRQGMTDVTWGTVAGDIPLTADFDGDGRTNIAIFRPGGTWRIQEGNQTITYSQTAGDVPIPADYNGDGKAEVGHWRPSESAWYIYGVGATSYPGHTNDVPVPGDYNGDGKTDIALFRKTGFWFIKGQRENVDFGNSTGIPAPGDYNGDGKTDLSVYNADTGIWYVEGLTGVTVVTPAAGDIPAPGDYDGDGKTDRAIYRPSNGTLYIYNGTNVSTAILGSSGYKLLNLPYHIRKYYPGFF